MYDQTAFEGLDKVIDAAAQYGLRLIVTMADAWNLVDSIKAVRCLESKASAAVMQAHYCTWTDVSDRTACTAVRSARLPGSVTASSAAQAQC